MALKLLDFATLPASAEANGDGEKRKTEGSLGVSPSCPQMQELVILAAKMGLANSLRTRVQAAVLQETFKVRSDCEFVNAHKAQCAKYSAAFKNSKAQGQAVELLSDQMGTIDVSGFNGMLEVTKNRLKDSEKECFEKSIAALGTMAVAQQCSTVQLLQDHCKVLRVEKMFDSKWKKLVAAFPKYSLATHSPPVINT